MRKEKLLNDNKMRFRLLVWKKSKCPLFNQHYPLLKPRTQELQGTKSDAACIYREVSRRFSSMVEAVEKDWLEG